MKQQSVHDVLSIETPDEAPLLCFVEIGIFKGRIPTFYMQLPAASALNNGLLQF